MTLISSPAGQEDYDADELVVGYILYYLLKRSFDLMSNTRDDWTHWVDPFFIDNAVAAPLSPASVKFKNVK